MATTIITEETMRSCDTEEPRKGNQLYFLSMEARQKYGQKPYGQSKYTQKVDASAQGRNATDE